MKKLLSISLIAIPLFFVNADWTSFRGSSGNGSSEYNTPGKIKIESNRSWSVDLPGRGLSSPILVGDSVFLSASSGPLQKNLHIMAFDAETGKKRWERNFKATGRTICHTKTCVAASTLASDGDYLVAQFSSNDVFCLDLKGNLRWLRGMTYDRPNIANGLGMSSSPVLVGGTVIIQTENDADSFSFGLDLQNGKTLWTKYRPKGANWTSPISFQHNDIDIVALQSKEGLTGINPSNGQELWSYKEGAATIPSSTWANDIILIPSNGITAIKLSHDGRNFSRIWRENKLKPGTGSPSFKDERIYVVNNANVLSCASAKSGEIHWRLRLEGPISSSPVLTSKYLYIFSEEGVGQVVNLSKDKPEVIHTTNLNDTILCTPALSDDAVYVRSDAKLWKLSD